MTQLECTVKEPESGVVNDTAPSASSFLDWRVIGTIAMKDLKITIRYPANLIIWGVVPILWIAPYLLMMTALSGSTSSGYFSQVSGYDDFVRFTVIGWFVYQYVDSSIWGIGNNFRWEQFNGTLEPLFLAPVSRVSILLGGALFNMIQTTISACILLGLSMLIFGASYSATVILPVLVVLFLMLLALSGFGFLLAGLIIVFKDPSVLTQLVSTAVFTITPVSYPVDVLPRPVRILSYLMPATLALVIIRELAIRGSADMSEYLWGIAGLMGLLVLFWAIGLLAFRYAERYTKQRGTMGGF